ncbi:MAG: M28 family peptidase, partial [Gemmatimonadota bacterium]
GVNRAGAAAADLGYGHIFVDRPRHNLTDDHLPLQQIGIPAIVVIDFDYGPDNSYWHTPSDTEDKVSPRSLEVVGRVALAVISRTR